MKTFKEIALIEPLQRALAQEEYHTPTPIQAQTIPAALKGRDVLGSAQTGTGKTAAFALPILNRLGQQNRKAKPHHPFALILAPTRELAIQIGKSFKTYGQNLRLKHCLVYGGVNQASQVRAMQRGAHVLVATPGRLLDLMNQGHIQLGKLEVFVLDEADRMLDMGFMPDLKRIIAKLPAKRQSLFFSATLAPSIVELTEKLLHNPISVDVTPKTRSVDRIEQRLVTVPRKGKQGLLTQILSGREVESAIVFTKTKRTANFVTEKLNKAGLKSVAIHGNKSQNARQRALDSFRKGFAKVMVATDVAARGIDIDGVTHVINFDLPMEPEAYVHRIGRTGRAGAEGIAISFCSEGDRSDLQAIERLIGQSVPVDRLLSEPLPAGGGSQKRSRGGQRGGGQRGRQNNQPSSRRSRSGSRGTPRSGARRANPDAQDRNEDGPGRETGSNRGGSSRNKSGRNGINRNGSGRGDSNRNNSNASQDGYPSGESTSQGKRPTKRRRRRNRTAGASNSSSPASGTRGAARAAGSETKSGSTKSKRKRRTPRKGKNERLRAKQQG